MINKKTFMRGCNGRLSFKKIYKKHLQDEVMVKNECESLCKSFTEYVHEKTKDSHLEKSFEHKHI